MWARRLFFFPFFSLPPDLIIVSGFRAASLDGCRPAQHPPVTSTSAFTQGVKLARMMRAIISSPGRRSAPPVLLSYFHRDEREPVERRKLGAGELAQGFLEASQSEADPGYCSLDQKGRENGNVVRA